MVKKLRERGQAMIEYAVLIPPMLLMSVSIVTLIPPTGYGMICDLDQAFNGGMCDNLTNPDGDQPSDGEDPAATPVPDDEEEGDYCVWWTPATGASLCGQEDGCDELPGENVGYYMADEEIDTFVIKAGQDYFVYESGITADGCYDVHISGGSVSWWRVGEGKTCKDVSHLQVWQVPWCE
jgi:hypothetical protein